jgi:hypothetical protein
MLHLHKAGIVLTLLLAAGAADRAQAQTFTTAPNPAQAGYLEQGYYYSDGEHDPTENNYLVGQVAASVGGPVFLNQPQHDFFTFDLSGLNLTGLQVTSATLVLQQFGSQSDSGQSSLDLALSGVSTDATTLNSFNGGLAVYNDLADGPSYGTFAVPVTAGPTDTFSATLDTAALQAIQNSAGSSFSIGGSLLNLPATGNEFLFGGSNVSSGSGYSPAQTLILTTAPAAVPEASTTISLGLLLALGAGGMAVGVRRRKAQSAE